MHFVRWINCCIDRLLQRLLHYTMNRRSDVYYSGVHELIIDETEITTFSSIVRWINCCIDRLLQRLLHYTMNRRSDVYYSGVHELIIDETEITTFSSIVRG
jgi:IS1 family transposase